MPELHNSDEQKENEKKPEIEQPIFQHKMGNAKPSIYETEEPLKIVESSSKLPSPTYIPVSMDPLYESNESIKRSSRLFPVFTRVRRELNNTQNMLNYADALVPPMNAPLNIVMLKNNNRNLDLVMGETKLNLNKQADSMESTTTTTEAYVMQQNKFMANLVHNVKFSNALPSGINDDDYLDTNNNINYDANFQDNYVSNRMTNKKPLMPSFHVTYWMFYPYSQGKTMCTLSLGPLGSIPFPSIYGYCLGNRKDIGSHIGDWEHMSLYFNGAAEPEAMYVSAHDAGAYYVYNRLTGSFEFKKQETRKGILQRPNFPKTVTTFNDHPVLFAAKVNRYIQSFPKYYINFY